MKKILIFSILVIISSVAFAGDWEFIRPYPQGNTYWDAASDGNGRVYMVGDAGTVTVFDGISFTQLNPPTDKALFGISILAPNDIWIAGGDGYAEESINEPVILHYDGQTWTEHTGPNYFDSGYTCNDIYASGSDDIWVLADMGTWIWHYDGMNWDWDMTTPAGTYGNYNSIYGFGPDDIYAVGTHGQIIHYNGSTWTLENQEESPDPYFTSNLLFAVWGTDPDNVYAAGNYGQAYKRNSDGTWTSITSWTGDYPQLNAIYGTSSTNMYFGGNGFYNYNGSGFTRLDNENLGAYINAITSAPGSTDAIIAGYNGRVPVE